MILYLCRWPNGDASFVGGRTLEEIDDVLDELDNSDRAEMIRIEDQAFALHFALKRKAAPTAGWSHGRPRVPGVPEYIGQRELV